jgi:hypothetical protein
MSSGRVLGALVAGISVVVVTGMLVSTSSPEGGSKTGANAPLVTTVLPTIPSLAQRHYVRADRLLDEARQAKRAGDIAQARYLAQTALNIRPVFSDALAFFNEL